LQADAAIHKVLLSPRPLSLLPPPSRWEQESTRTKQPKVRSRSTGLGLLLGGLGVMAGGGMLIWNGIEEKTMDPVCIYGLGCGPRVTYTEINKLKAGVGGGMVGAGAFMVVRGIMLMR